MLWGALVLAASAVALVNGVLVLRTPPVDPDDDPFGDEAVWDERLRVMGWVAVAIGAAGCVLGVALGLG